MATTYGPIEGRLSVGINVSMSPSTVTSSTTSVTITWTVYARSDSYGFNDPQTMTMSNAMSDTQNYTMVSGTVNDVIKYVWSGSQSVSTSTSGTVTKTLTAAASGLFNGGTPSHTRSITIPKRPFATPAAPSAVTAVRNSDTQATIAWTNNATTGAPYTSLTVQRARYNGVSWDSWVTVATTSSTATTYVDTSVSTNNKYKYQVRSNNNAGSSGYVAAAANVLMTPAAPSSVTAAGVNNGAQIQVSWVDAAYIDSTITWTVQRSVNGAAYADVATGIAQGTVTWTDPTPGAGSNQYRVSAVQSVGSLASDYTSSNVVSTIIAPLAPTLLNPDGGARDLAVDQVFSWRHNHGGDGLGQSHYTVEYSSDGGTTWIPLVTYAASAFTLTVVPGGTLTNGVTYLWRAATQGSTTVAFSPWSASATVTGSSTPTVTLSAPPGSVTSLPVVAAWAYNQDEMSPQTAWEANLYSVDGLTLLEALSGSDDSSSASFSYPLADATSYLIKVRARSGAGIWSEWASTSFNFSLLPPAAGIIEAEFQPCSGTAVLSISTEAVIPDVTVAAVSVTLERSIDNGSWVTLASGIAPPFDFLDLLPTVNGRNDYRVTTVSSYPSYNVSAPVTLTGTDGASDSGLWVFLSYGDSFEKVLRVHGDLQITEGTGRLKTSHNFLGRTKPVQLIGQNLSRTVDVSGSLFYDHACRDIDAALDCTYDSPPDDWNVAGQEAEVVAYRDYTGRRLFGMLSDVNASEGVWPLTASTSFTVTEIDYVEPGGTTPRENPYSETNMLNGYTETFGCAFTDQLNGYSTLT